MADLRGLTPHINTRRTNLPSEAVKLFQRVFFYAQGRMIYTMPATVKVNSGYSIKIRKGLVQRLGIEILRLNEENEAETEHEILLVTDEKVSGLYLQKVITNFQECPKPDGTKLRICELLINSHERAKNFHTVTKLLDDMAGLGLSKKCCVVALGGGVVCDAAGFAAGCYMGGVKLVLVPTTLAAMIEASVGGNAFLNLSTGKNLAGMIHTPSLVLCDTECLRTLSPEEYKSGIAETLKTAIMAGENLFRIFERGEVAGNIENIIDGCIKFRAGVSMSGEIRSKCLGYEIGNAIESLSNYEIQHGLALAEGIGIVANASAKMGWCSEDTKDRIINTLKRNDLPVTCRKFKPEIIAQNVLNGRKIAGGNIELVVPSEIGRCETKNIDTGELEKIIACGM